MVKVDRRIRWHYTTTILRLRIGARLTRHRDCKFHNFARTIVPPSAGPFLPLVVGIGVRTDDMHGSAHRYDCTQFWRCSAAIYRHLLSDRKFGLTHNLLATRVMPSLIPLSISPGYSLDQVQLLALSGWIAEPIDGDARIFVAGKQNDLSSFAAEHPVAGTQICVKMWVGPNSAVCWWKENFKFCCHKTMFTET